MTKPATFQVSVYATPGNESATTAIGSVSHLTADAMIEHVASIHEWTTGVEMMVFPFNEQRCPSLRADGTLYPIFAYRVGRETQLTPAQLREVLRAYANGEAELTTA